jgi:HlyD family secretion protein
VSSRRWTILGLVVLVAVVATATALRLQDGDGGDASASADSVTEEIRSSTPVSRFAADVAVPVEGARVRRDTFVMWVESEGRAEARRAAPLRADVAGRVVEVPVREGQRVRAGQLVARLDSTEQALAVQRERARLEKARADYRARLLGEGELGLTEEELEERRRQARVQSGVAEAEVALEEARLELRKTRIRAPYAGRVANLAVSEGARLSPGDSVAIVLDLSQVEVDVEVLQTRVTHLEPGRRARVRFTALPGESFPGRVVTLNPMVDPGRETVRVTVRLDNPEARILPGMHATVRIAGRLHGDRIFVPRDAVVERDRRDVVFLFSPSGEGGATGRAKWKYVTTGLESDEFVEIVPSGDTEVPEPGRIVLTEGHATLSHDARVRLENAEELAAGGDS